MGSTKTIRIIAYKSGMIPSAIVPYAYSVNIVGATPSVLGSGAPTGYQGGSTTNSATYTFTATDTAIIWVNWINDIANPTSVTCGGTAATLINSASETVDNNRATAIYILPSLSAGSHTCTATWATAVNSSMLISEVSGTSGVDVSSGSGAGASATYPNIACGTITTTGANRLVLAAGMMDASAVNIASGYSQLFTQSGFTGESINQASAGTFTPYFTTNNNYGATCVAFALKP